MTHAIAPHEAPCPPGAAADRAARLAGLVPVLEAPRVRLRAPGLDDFPAWAEILCSDRAAWMDGPYTRDGAFMEFAVAMGAWLLRGHGAFAVEPREGGAALGFVCVNMEPSDREPELGWFLRASAEGRGLAFEAAGVARDWALAQGLASLVSYVDPANLRSQALAARLGARRDPAAEAEFTGSPDAGVQVWRHAGGIAA